MTGQYEVRPGRKVPLASKVLGMPPANRPSDTDDLIRLPGDPEGWHVRAKTEDGYPLMGSSPAERQEAEDRTARIKAQAMRDHLFEGDGPYCQARIGMRATGSDQVGYVSGWVGCGYPRDTHPEED